MSVRLASGEGEWWVVEVGEWEHFGGGWSDRRDGGRKHFEGVLGRIMWRKKNVWLMSVCLEKC